MSKEIAKKLIAELQENEELRAKTAGITDKDELVKMANEAGFDVTLEELIEADREYRKQLSEKTDSTSDELSADELEGAAGGMYWDGDNSEIDGHELGCRKSYHDVAWTEQKGDVCRETYHCYAVNFEKITKDDCFKYMKNPRYCSETSTDL